MYFVVHILGIKKDCKQSVIPRRYQAGIISTDGKGGDRTKGKNDEVKSAMSKLIESIQWV